MAYATMTQVTYDGVVQRRGKPLACFRCAHAIEIGTIYHESFTAVQCGPCALKVARSRVEKAERLLAAERDELAALEEIFGRR